MDEVEAEDRGKGDTEWQGGVDPTVGEKGSDSRITRLGRVGRVVGRV